MKLFNGRGIFSLAAAALFALVAFAGCGGGDSTASEAPPQSKAQFAKQAEAVCKEAHQGLEGEYLAFQEEHKTEGKLLEPEQQNEFAEDSLYPSMEEEAEKLAELGPPKGEEAKANALVAALEAIVAEGETKSAVKLDPRSWEQLRSSGEALGLKECSESI